MLYWGPEGIMIMINTVTRNYNVVIKMVSCNMPLPTVAAIRFREAVSRNVS